MILEVIKGDGKLLENIDLAPANVHQEVLQNVAIILDTVQQSCLCCGNWEYRALFMAGQ